MKIQATDITRNRKTEEFKAEGLTEGKVYEVIGVEGEFFRIVDDSNEPILFSKELFKVIDATIPSDWIETKFDDELYIEPPETNKPGFYEDFFDDKPYAIKKFQELLIKMKQ